MNDRFLTLKEPSEGFYMDRGSKFLAYAFPVRHESEVSRILQQVRKAHPKARHFCTALRLFPDASLERSNDDGEPSGSAGKPILGQLVKNKLTNVLLVVVRYFGGTKLGVPGLIEAYKTSAANAIQSGNIIEQKVYSKVRIHMQYDTHPPFLNFCKQSGIPVLEETFSERAAITLCFGKSSTEDELLQTFSKYSQMDFHSCKEYATYLGVEIEITDGEIIL